MASNQYGNENRGRDIVETNLDSTEMEDSATELETRQTYSTSDKKQFFNMSPRSSPSHNLSVGDVNTWRRCAITICWLCIVTSIVLGILSFSFSVQDDSSAAFGFAVTALLNALTSLVVVWRYYGAFSAYSEKKEDKALVVLGVLFILSSICTGGKTIYSLIVGIHPDISKEAAEKLIIISITAIVLFTIISVAQIITAKKLASCTLFTDALNSFTGALVALSLVITWTFSEYHPGYWYLDEISGIVIGCFLFIYGVVLLTKYIPILLRTTDYHEAA